MKAGRRHFKIVTGPWTRSAILVVGILCLPCNALAADKVSTDRADTWADLFTEQENVISLENRSRRKWDNALVADLDQDGFQDLLLTEHSRNASIFWNDGGTFSEPQIIARGDTHGVAAGDYDHDGRMDLVIYPGGGGGKKPKNPVAYQVNRDRTIVGGDEFSHFERSRGRAAKLIDADNDGALDLVITAFPLKTQGNEGANQLFKNVGGGEFEFVAKLPRAKWMGFRLLTTDFNDDGDADLILYGGKNVVAARGEEGFAFSESSQALTQLAETTFVSSLAEIDFDNDGDFDLFVTRADHPFDETTDYNSKNQCFAYYIFAAFVKDVVYQYELQVEGDFRMENLQMAFPDFDVFVGEEKRQLEFDVDRHGGKDFTLTADEAAGWPSEISDNGLYIGHLGDGVWRVGGKTKSSTSGVVHNVTSPPETTTKKQLPAKMFENRNGTFVDVTTQLGISIPDQTTSAAVGDFDNDGWSDLFVVRQGNPGTSNKQILYVNRSGQSFRRVDTHNIVSSELGATGGGAEAFDYDNDGDLDLIFGNERGRWHLYTNNNSKTEDRNFVTVKVGSSPSGKATAQGAALTLEAGGKTYRRVVGGSSAAFSHSANSHLHIGLGECSSVDKAELRWTNGEREVVPIDAVNKVFQAGKLP